ncbi:TPA: radical SAM protein [Candidatus Woesearchaeota archaeon]|nr:radical SAM protein [Candidatus Woesearchaeota archaeon]
MRSATHFERAVFLSWYCSKGDCKFCYMSTQKALISDPVKARRSLASILAEVLVCKAAGWRVEFLSGGYDSYSMDELVEICRLVHLLTGDRQWLNIGALSEDELMRFKPYVVGVCGAVEVIDPALHAHVCPSKPVSDIEAMFSVCDRLGLRKAMTMIVGLGEERSHFAELRSFIENHRLDRITFYRLKPQEGTPFTKGPLSEDYVWWVSETRKAFPDIEIVVGSWLSHLDELSSLLKAGADSMTKFPSIRLFGSEEAGKIESEAGAAGREFEGTLTDFSRLKAFDWDSCLSLLDPGLASAVRGKLASYLGRMQIN